MVSNPFLGVFFHWLGGLASGSFYVPYRGVRKWSWEVYWLVGGFFSWIIAPWVLASLNTSELLSVLHEAPGDSIAWAYFWGAMWGLGGLTFGLTMRYLGLSLGMGVALGYCAAFGTLMPPIFHGEFMTKVLGTGSGQVILFGVFRVLMHAHANLRPVSVLALAVSVTLLVTPYTWTYDQLLLTLPLTTVILAMDRSGVRFPLTASVFLGIDVFVVILLFFDVMLQVEILNVLVPLVIFCLCLWKLDARIPAPT